MQVMCLGVLVDPIQGTIVIPEKKLHKIAKVVCQLQTNDVASKRLLQSILDLLLYVHKCVKSAHVLLNRMLELLRKAQHKTIVDTQPQNRPRCFAEFSASL